MAMTASIRKFALTAHITFSVGWLGAAIAYLALAIAGLNSQDAQMVRAAYLSMAFIGWFVIVPFSLAALSIGLAQSLGTEWGLFRYYWILVKFLLTTGATIILLLHMQAVSRMSGVAAETILSSADFRALRIQLVVHAAGGLLVLLAATTLSVYKPWGMTPYGQRKQHERRKMSQAELPSHPKSINDGSVGRDWGFTTSTPRWVYVVGVHALGLLIFFVVLHLTGAGLPSH